MKNDSRSVAVALSILILLGLIGWYVIGSRMPNEARLSERYRIVGLISRSLTERISTGHFPKDLKELDLRGVHGHNVVGSLLMVDYGNRKAYYRVSIDGWTKTVSAVIVGFPKQKTASNALPDGSPK